jgi:hypothetical protein
MTEKKRSQDEYLIEDEGFISSELDTNYYNFIYAGIIFILSFIIHNTHTYDFVGKVLTQLTEQIGLGQFKVLFKGNTLVGVHSALLILMIYLLDQYVFPMIIEPDEAEILI